jgi:hypothetical protein
MLPDFDDDGNLPVGIHRATIEEVVARFGRGPPERRIETRELVDFVSWARKVRVSRVLVNGSFVTSKRAPNDVDVVILPTPESFAEPGFEQFGDAVWPFLQVLVAADDDDFERWANGDFATDRRGRPKGVLEIIL